MIMKRLLILASFAFLMTTFANAQSPEAKKAFNSAKKAMLAFNSSGTNEEKLKDAIEAIDIALQDDVNAKNTKLWAVKGSIYNGVVNSHQSLKFLPDSEDHVILDDQAGFKAYEAYAKALELAEKKGDIRTALKGMTTTLDNLDFLGRQKFEEKDYESAFKNFDTMFEVANVLKEQGESTKLDDPALKNDQLFYTGIAAISYGNNDGAKKYFEPLVGTDYKEGSLIYDSMYKIYKDEDPAKALEYLTEGRDKFPDDVNLLFSEINYYLTAGQFDKLEARLKEAINKEPTNPSLYYTLGRVYSDVSGKKKEEGDDAAAEDYFNKAIEQYNEALKVKPDFYEGVYGIGEMYYNKAAAISKQLEDFPVDGSTKEYNALKDAMDEQFSNALPYFQKTEKLNPNDINTLIALGEIYARRDDFEKSKIFKERLQVVRDGGSNESYFENN